ncbi:YhjD/YihY/BrkB family envelope integrity protein, partial [Kitasatospora sp. NPDC047058]|uniref:YhjD/YihY/BrkB family envelope integrity protein n=1 Tax=Kitasatospora sp. NPDC047058 TaxID=3155620 RepID=UPI0033EF7FFB
KGALEAIVRVGPAAENATAALTSLVEPGEAVAHTGTQTEAKGPGARRVRRAADWGQAKYTGSWAEYLWHRLDAVDFLSQAMLLAATLLLCAFPFMIIVTALLGRSVVSTLGLRLGLNHEASDDVGRLFASDATTSAAITGLSWVFFVLGGLASAAAIQQLYQKVFQVGPQGPWDRLRALGWLALVVVWVYVGSTGGKVLYADAPALGWIVHVPVFIGFWWFTMWFLLAGRITWRRLLPCAVATGVFWTGMLLVFHAIYSGMVVSYYEEYGPIGVVFALMSFLIAIGVVIILGAATGMMWHDRGMSFRAALTKMRRRK